MQEQLQPGAIKADRMTVSLRKANALQESIMETIRGIGLDTTITLTEFDDVDTKLNDAQAKLVKNLARIDNLYGAYYDIRMEVANRNTRCDTDGGQSISAKLAMIAQHEKIIGVLTGQANTIPRTDVNIIKGKLAKIAKGSTDSASVYGRRDEVTTTILDEDMIAEIKTNISSLKNTKRKLQDSLLEDNISMKITLPQNVVDVLKVENLI